jgi:predicted HTH transcriptional regulator
LTRKGKLTNAAVLLFAKEPQRFIYSSEIKCAHFHGTTVQKPIPFYQVYKGNLFDLVDQSVNFVLSKIDLAVGTRANGPVVPVSYEIPPPVISEAIVNAIAHRDYTSTASVQVMLFADRLEIWNPGTLPAVLTLQSLRETHGSYPANPLIAEPLYLTKYIERMGTGIPDMVERCRQFGLPSPEFKLTDGFVTTIWRKKDIAFHTVGQRRGLGISSPERQYVVKLDPDRNEVVLGSAPELVRSELTAGQLHWVGEIPVWRELRVTARIRYRGSASKATLARTGDDRLRVIFDEPQKAVTPGQSVVFYDNERVLGGGIIES